MFTDFLEHYQPKDTLFMNNLINIYQCTDFLPIANFSEV